MTVSSLSRRAKKALSVEGQISALQCEALFELAARVSSGCIVEIGSFRGRSAVALGLGSLANGRVPVYAIDPHESFTGALGATFGPQDRTAFFKNVLRTGVTEVVRLINLPAEAVSKGWEQPIALLWIDGDHRYEAVKNDFGCWEPFVVAGGMIAFDDSINRSIGPWRVIEEAVSSNRFRVVQRVGPMTVLEKQR